jgi:hypothetical protein
MNLTLTCDREINLRDINSHILQPLCSDKRWLFRVTFQRGDISEALSLCKFICPTAFTGRQNTEREPATAQTVFEVAQKKAGSALQHRHS